MEQVGFEPMVSDSLAMALNPPGLWFVSNRVITISCIVIRFLVIFALLSSVKKCFCIFTNWPHMALAYIPYMDRCLGGSSEDTHGQISRPL